MPKKVSPAEIINDYEEKELDEKMQSPNPVAPPSDRLIVKRNGHNITRKIPKPT